MVTQDGSISSIANSGAGPIVTGLNGRAQQLVTTGTSSAFFQMFVAQNVADGSTINYPQAFGGPPIAVMVNDTSSRGCGASNWTATGFKIALNGTGEADAIVVIAAGPPANVFTPQAIVTVPGEL